MWWMVISTPFGDYFCISPLISNQKQPKHTVSQQFIESCKLIHPLNKAHWLTRRGWGHGKQGKSPDRWMDEAGLTGHLSAAGAGVLLQHLLFLLWDGEKGEKKAGYDGQLQDERNKCGIPPFFSWHMTFISLLWLKKSLVKTNIKALRTPAPSCIGVLGGTLLTHCTASKKKCLLWEGLSEA